jgi:hypothetical protein
MATSRVTASVAAQTIFTVPLHMKAKIDAINIDNQGGSGKIQVSIRDSFTQDLSQGVAAPAARVAFPWTGTIPQNQFFEEDVLALEKIDVLGVGAIICSATDAACIINIQWHLE